MDTTQRRTPDAGDVNDVDNEDVEVEGFIGEDVASERLLKDVVKLVAREKT